MYDFWNHMTKRYCETVLLVEGDGDENCPKLVEKGCGFSDTCTAKQRCIPDNEDATSYVCQGKI